jgi:hypothetical protein
LGTSPNSFSHAKHLFCPLLSCARPFSQATQRPGFFSSPCFPISHLSHDVNPVFVVVYANSQIKHEVAAWRLLRYFPTSQSKQTLPMFLEYFPASHFSHFVAPLSEDDHPAGQTRQRILLENVPFLFLLGR